jgi:hypothetical protein
VKKGINITYYEIAEKFQACGIRRVVLDESSILKSYMGKTMMALVEAFRETRSGYAVQPRRPEHHMEILNHAEFLGVMKSSEALAIWFINDTNNMGTYRLKNPRVQPFWEWVSTWAVCIQKPSDLGYPDGDFKLPPAARKREHPAVDYPGPYVRKRPVRKIETNRHGHTTRKTLHGRYARLPDGGAHRRNGNNTWSGARRILSGPAQKITFRTPSRSEAATALNERSPRRSDSSTGISAY